MSTFKEMTAKIELLQSIMSKDTASKEQSSNENRAKLKIKEQE